eukprot:4313347-Amphidinium_carterae.1
MSLTVARAMHKPTRGPPKVSFHRLQVFLGLLSLTPGSSAANQPKASQGLQKRIAFAVPLPLPIALPVTNYHTVPLPF